MIGLTYSRGTYPIDRMTDGTIILCKGATGSMYKRPNRLCVWTTVLTVSMGRLVSGF